VQTSSGFAACLEKIPNPTLFGNDVDNLAVDLTFETDHRVRIRVGLIAGGPVVYQNLFHDLVLRSSLYHCVWSVITAHNLTPEKRDNNRPTV